VTQKKWNIEAFFDSDFGEDNNWRRSITGFFVIVFIPPISLKFESQGNVTLSSTVAEYVALSGTVRKVKHIAHMLKNLRINYRKPI
jgi:hypothetical protein